MPNETQVGPIPATDNRVYEIRMYHLADPSIMRPILEITGKHDAIQFVNEWNKQAADNNENFRVTRKPL